MDLARAGAKRDAQFFTDASQQNVTIRWYQCPPNAKVFPTQHKWGKLDWYTQPWAADGVGEVYDAKQSYSPRETPEGVTGQSYFGPLEYFQNGVTYDPEVNTPRRDDGIAEGCVDCEGNFIAIESGECAFVLEEDAARILLEIQP